MSADVQWEIGRIQEGIYTMTNLKSQGVLIHASAKADGKMELWPKAEWDPQSHWELTRRGFIYKFRNVKSGGVMTHEHESASVLKEYSERSALWTLERAGCHIL